MMYLAFYTVRDHDRSWNRNQEHRLGRALLSFGLAREYGISKDQIHIKTADGGKPYLTGYPEIYFNISHCDGAVICGIHSCEIGVDIETVRPYSGTLARRILTDREKADLEKLAEPEKSEMMTRFWTLKESYMKALGAGLSRPFREIAFQWDADDQVSGSDPDFSHVVCTVRTHGKFQIAVSIKQREGMRYDISGSI